MTKYQEYKAKAYKLDQLIALIEASVDCHSVGTVILIKEHRKELSITLDKVNNEFRINR